VKTFVPNGSPPVAAAFFFYLELAFSISVVFELKKNQRKPPARRPPLAAVHARSSSSHKPTSRAHCSRVRLSCAVTRRPQWVQLAVSRLFAIDRASVAAVQPLESLLLTLAATAARLARFNPSQALTSSLRPKDNGRSTARALGLLGPFWGSSGLPSMSSQAWLSLAFVWPSSWTHQIAKLVSLLAKFCLGS